MAAQTLSRSQSALGAFYRQMKARLGGPKAITATAHKIARVFYHVWSTGDAYVDPGVDTYEQKYRERVLKQLQHKAQVFGVALVPQVSSIECVS